ncbi:MAG: type II secretion system protein [Actinobacteria bacterium]|nr:type II secretion system protein [Actinomycetota bacterium]
MLVATFGPATAWEGREIIWDVDHFILVGHGAIPAEGVLDYDRLGQLVWARPELRSWVWAVSRWESGRRAAAGGGSPSTAGTTGAAGSSASPGRLPTWAIVVIAAVIALVVLGGVAAALVIPGVVRTTESIADDVMVRAGAETIHAGIESYALAHGGRYPSEGAVDPVGLAGYVSWWPENPYSGGPMADGGGEGNFRYDLSPDGGAYRLTAYGRGGRVILELSGGTDTSV